MEHVLRSLFTYKYTINERGVKFRRLCGGSSCSGSRGSNLTCTLISLSIIQFSEFGMIIYTVKSTFIFSNFNFLKATVHGEKRRVKQPNRLDRRTSRSTAVSWQLLCLHPASCIGDHSADPPSCRFLGLFRHNFAEIVPGPKKWYRKTRLAILHNL